ncbi:MAG: helix-turn-helix domain-containing protein [Oscillospiraceae bacterium]|nr:helix-turn-helix domain-containing protein [Oscillospiraceae bacterium]
MSTEHEKWSSIEELAAHLQVHKDTIRLWIKKNEIPAHKIGKLWRFKISEIDDWILSGRSAKIGNDAD